MLLDWTTARIPLENISEEARNAALELGDRIVCYCPKSGEVKYETFRWESMRSDSHQIAARAGSDLWVQGSPARVIADGCAVFGAGPAAALDVVGCTQRMVDFLAGKLNVSLPSAENWIVTRVDVTGNLAMQSLSQVRQALTVLRNCEGGRYRVSQQDGETVYWSQRSKLRAGKAYPKGPHLRYLMKKMSYDGKRYTESEILDASRLLRLELKLGREWFARNPWQNVEPEQFRSEWESYFSRMIGGCEVATETDLKDRIFAIAPTEGQAKAAFGCWTMIQSQGWEAARDMFPKTTWYRNISILRQAGLADADISAGHVVPLRRRIIEAQLVTSWNDIAA